MNDSMSRTALLIVALLLVSISPSWSAEPQDEQAKAVAQIKKIGGKVTVDEKSPDKQVIGVDLSETKATDETVKHLEGLTKLQSLNLSNCELNGRARFV
jgi:internalin A